MIYSKINRLSKNNNLKLSLKNEKVKILLTMIFILFALKYKLK